MTSQLTHAPLAQLHIDKNSNVRRAADAEPEFVASIGAKGVIEDLIVRVNGMGFKVTNGGKRLSALQWMRDKGLTAKGVLVTDDYQVPIKVRDEDDTEARETSLTTNLVRSGMHPVEEFRAFAKMEKDGKPRDAIAVEYVIERDELDRILALGALADPILDAWLAGTIQRSVAEAFTLAPDEKAQNAAFEKLSKKRGGFDDDDVKREFKAHANDGARYVDFVGVEAYRARGGKVTQDLFGKDHIVSDAKLAKAMAAEKLEEIKKRLAEDGWSFVIDKPGNYYSYGSIRCDLKPTKEEKERIVQLDRLSDYDNENVTDREREQAQSALDALNAQIEARSYTAEQKARSGCFVTLGSDGLDIDYGRVKPAEIKAAKTHEQRERRQAVKSGKKERPKAPTTLSNALKQRLSNQLADATRAALKAESALRSKDGLAALLTGIAAEMIEARGMVWSAPHDLERKLPAVRDAISPQVMNDAVRKAFDATDYFTNAPVGFTMKAIEDACGAAQAKALKGKKRPELAKFAIANVAKAKWLPAELRTAHYDGPGAKRK